MYFIIQGAYLEQAGPAHLGGRLSGAECDGAHSEHCGSASDCCRIFYGKLCGKSAQEMWKQAGFCVAGFLAGFLGVFLVICIQYGPGAYFGMFGSLAGYTATDESYSPFSMITSIFAAYGKTMVWLMVIAVCVLAGWIFSIFFPNVFTRRERLYTACAFRC